MNKILLIGNSEPQLKVAYGQSAKVRIYRQKIADEGCSVVFVELYNFIKRPFSTLFAIKKGIKECNRIVLLTASRGCKILIPFINKINKKYKKPFILPLIGSSVLHYSIDKLSDDKKNSFLVDENYSLCKPNKKLCKELKKIDWILPETDLISKVFRDFYGLKNVLTLTNFRDGQALTHSINLKDNALHLVYLSRVMKMKGIFDLLECVSYINNTHKYIKLDIYGDVFFDKKDRLKFESYLNSEIRYLGSVDNNQVINTFGKYDLFVFPTRFISEGTPGVIVESLIAGTPVLTSDFPQAKFLLKDGYDSIFYRMFDVNDLKNKLIFAADNKKMIVEMSKNASISGNKYTYAFVSKDFRKYICGIDEDSKC